MSHDCFLWYVVWLPKDYVNDAIVKYKEVFKRVNDLRKIFVRLRQNKLRMNPLRSTFVVSSEKFLGFTAYKEEIEIQLKLRLSNLWSLSQPVNSWRVPWQSVLCRRFFPALTELLEPFHKLLKKNAPIRWEEKQQNACHRVKDVLYSI